MKITLKYLRILWNPARIDRLRNGIFFVGSENLLNKNSNCNLNNIDAIWSKNHDRAVEKRNKNKNAKHIFISKICDVAVEEYETVCKLLKIQVIKIVGLSREKDFFETSKKMLATIPNVKIQTFVI